MSATKNGVRKLEAYGATVLVEPDPVAPSKLELLPSTQKAIRESQLMLEGTIVSVGNGVIEGGLRMRPDLRIGNRVLYGQALPITVDERTLDVVKEEWIVAVYR
jgi:co-chaperonin GroES (HSP10)